MKFAFIQAQKAVFPVEMMCQHLCVSRSGYYAFCQRRPSVRKAQDRALAEQIQGIHQRSRGTYGRPRVQAVLRSQGIKTSSKRVGRLMKQEGYRYALFKLGWIYYELTDFSSAKQAFLRVQDLITHPNGRPSAGDADLEKETRHGIILCYAHLDKPGDAWLFLQKYAKDDAPKRLADLADIYNSQGKFADSNRAYRQLIELSMDKGLFPENGRLCSWQTEIVKNTLSMTGSRATPATVEALQSLVAVYEQFKQRKDLPKKERLEECRENTAGMLRELATVWHKEAQKTGDSATYSQAAAMYKEYLRETPDGKDAYLMRFWYSELLYKLGTIDKNSASHWFCEAARLYKQVVEMDSKGPKAEAATEGFALSQKKCRGLSGTSNIQVATLPAAKEVQPRLDQDLVRRIIRRHINEIVHCFQMTVSLWDNSTPRGTQSHLSHPGIPSLDFPDDTVEIDREAPTRWPGARTVAEFNILESGNVGEAQLSGDDNNATLRRCVLSAIKQWQFPRPSGGPVTVIYPFAVHAAASEGPGGSFNRVFLWTPDAPSVGDWDFVE